MATQHIDENGTIYLKRSDGLIKYITPMTNIEDVKDFLTK